ncbi:6-phosphofructokinase [Rhodohalobacter halophilus]|uniref:6-phosphofructokinase n=1 Tax=Rhodohalobacter halophilus TaxID=1812810 RepID=UPI00083FA975|nr:6-phosphofructokinase [Rhodohalobacter halophilus]
MKKIGVLTSGGDSPGMNAAFRAVVRTAKTLNMEVMAIRHGYKGLIEDDITKVTPHDVSNIIQRGGTVLKSARCDEFRTKEGREKAANVLKKHKIEALITIGGDGTFQGATHLANEHDINVIGVPATIDNDLVGSDETIGYDTALNTAMEAIDKIRDTADAHDRLFLVEVMGRDAGFIALETGIAGGAELILLPESLTDIDDVKASLNEVLSEQRRSSLVVIAEGDDTGGALKISEELKPDFSKYEMRVCILGHVQRGGNPTARDRVLASRLGSAAVSVLNEGHSQVMVGVVNNKVKLTPLKMTFGKKKDINFDLLELAKTLR